MNGRGPLPSHLRTGRGAMGGPVPGGYLVFGGHVENFATVAETVVAAWSMPMDVRLHAYCHYVTDVGVSTLSTALYSNATPDLTGTPTQLIALAASHTTNASGKLITIASEDGINTSTTLVRTQTTRNIARGQWVVVTLAQAAADSDDVSFFVIVSSRDFASTTSGAPTAAEITAGATGDD